MTKEDLRTLGIKIEPKDNLHYNMSYNFTDYERLEALVWESTDTNKADMICVRNIQIYNPAYDIVYVHIMPVQYFRSIDQFKQLFACLNYTFNNTAYKINNKGHVEI